MIAQELAEFAHILLVLAMGAVVLIAGNVPVGVALALFLFLFAFFLSHLVDHLFVFLDPSGVFQYHLSDLGQLQFCCQGLVIHRFDYFVSNTLFTAAKI